MQEGSSSISQKQDPRIILALDFKSLSEGKKWVDRLKPYVVNYKVGPAMFLENGLEGVKKLDELGINIFLDMKFHDIPNTVKLAVSSLVESNVWMFTIHSLGGYDMMKTVCEEVSENAYKYSKRKPLVVAVTVLTSHDSKYLQEVGINGTVRDTVCRLAELAQKAGVDGLVCSGYELDTLKKEFGDRFKLVVPGVRMGDNTHDQKRIVSPRDALLQGASYIVVGRTVTLSPTPEEKVKKLLSSISDL